MRVSVVGAGMSGIACAAALRLADVDVRVLERGARPGGRMAGQRIDGRTVDLGAAYLTATDPEFLSVVDDWCRRGLARPWTTTFAVAGPDGVQGSSAGPVRYAAPFGLSTLVGDLARDLTVEARRDVRELDPIKSTSDTVVLALPDPEAAALTGAEPELAWEAVLAVVLRYTERSWPIDLHGCFVNDHPVLSFVADDGDRRGDGAPVLVAHTTGEYAATRPDDVAAVVDEVRRTLGLSAEPESVTAHLWPAARPVGTHATAYDLAGGIGRCGDAWGQQPRVQTAWLSGRSLAREIVGGRPTA